MKTKKVCSGLILAGIILFVPFSRVTAEEKNALVTMNSPAAALPEVLRGISEIADVDIIIPQELADKVVTVKLDQVPWEKALEVILDDQGYTHF